MISRRLLARLYGILLLLAATLIGGCTTAPDAQTIRQVLGIRQSFAHNDVPAPSTPAGFVRALGIGQAASISISNPQIGQTQTITDPQQIAAVVDVLRQGNHARPHDQAAPTAQDIIHLTVRIAPPERTVVVMYNARRRLLTLFNVPTRTWPDHMVADYPVPETFGQALLEALGSRAVSTP